MLTRTNTKLDEWVQVLPKTNGTRNKLFEVPGEVQRQEKEYFQGQHVEVQWKEGEEGWVDGNTLGQVH